MSGKVLFPDTTATQHAAGAVGRSLKRRDERRSPRRGDDSLVRSPPSTTFLDDLPSWKPPTSYHDFRGDVRSQDVFADAFEAHRETNQRHLVLYPGQDAFQLSQYDMWNLAACCTPSLILQPRDAGEVSSCLKGYDAGVRACVATNRRENRDLQIPRLCVAGGRNSPLSMLDGAIVLDLSLMRSVDVDSARGVVRAQGGARVSDLDRALARHGLAAATGSFKNLGVVGTILSGGHGYASRKHGLSADNVVRARVVTADGAVLRCDDETNADLLWAVRGGGGGVGVVTEVDLRCFPLRNAAYCSFRLYAPTARRRARVLREWGAWANDPELPEEVSSQLLLSTRSSSIRCFSASIDADAIPQTPLRSDGDRTAPVEWFAVPGLKDLARARFGALTRSRAVFRVVPYHDGLQSAAGREWFRTPGNTASAFRYAAALTPAVVDALVDALSSSSARGRILVGAAGGAVRNAPGGAGAAFSARGAAFWIHAEGRWYENDDARTRARARAWARATADRLDAVAGVAGTCHAESALEPAPRRSDGHPGRYNHSRENGERLRRTRLRYDPRRVFSLGARVDWPPPDARRPNEVLVGDARHDPRETAPPDTPPSDTIADERSDDEPADSFVVDESLPRADVPSVASLRRKRSVLEQTSFGSSDNQSAGAKEWDRWRADFDDFDDDDATSPSNRLFAVSDCGTGDDDDVGRSRATTGVSNHDHDGLGVEAKIDFDDGSISFCQTSPF